MASDDIRQKYENHNPRLVRGCIDISGDKYGTLTAIKFIEVRNHKAIWLMACDCGNFCLATTNELRTGYKKTCGVRRNHIRKYSDKEIQELLFRKVITEPNSPCWIWDGALNENGYGVFYIGSRKGRLAHRVSYSVHYGVDPETKFVCHACDMPPCINPAHLFLGDPITNIKDMIKKGRKVLGRCTTHGSAHPLSKLTNSKVLYIRECGLSANILSRDMGVSKSTINKIRNNKTWKHI